MGWFSLDGCLVLTAMQSVAVRGGKGVHCV